MPSHPEFEIIQERTLAELNAKGTLYRHKASGAQYLSIENDDENKVFGITFRTPVSDSTGVPHILEHSVLNGSEKYPLKEPFVELIKGSLNTFLNAFTYPDKTCYPVASQNTQDLYNLVDVYIDAVLHPRLLEHILNQEGWHLHLEEADGEIIFKGVVFNEMKGAMSNPDARLFEAIQNGLFPDNTYRYNSGGDPAIITDLTYAQFRGFWETYYHPSNARIFWYGDDDPQERLNRLAGYLSGYMAKPVDSTVGVQVAFGAARAVAAPYPAGEEDAEKHFITLNWGLPPDDDPETNLALSILGHILVGTPASPLRKALIDSGLGEDIAGPGLESDLRQLVFGTGLRGVKAGDVDKVSALILNTLESLAKDGIDPDTVAASLNTVEFRLRENNTGHFPRGLLLMLRALATWLHDGDPFASLAFDAPLATVKSKTAKGKFFEGLIRQYLLDNSHRLTVHLQPDTGLNDREAEAEAARLKEITAGLTADDRQRIHAATQRLMEIQHTPDSPEALATLPMLKLSDLEREAKPLPIEVGALGDAKLLTHDVFTNGIVYLDLAFDLHAVPQTLLPYLSLFADGLTQMGTKSQDFVKLAQRIGRDTGGVGASLLLEPLREQRGSAAYLVLRAKAALDKTPEMLGILTDILLEVNFDNPQRFKQILLENKSELESAILPAGTRFVNRRLMRRETEAGWLQDELTLLGQLFFLRDLAEKVEKDWPSVLAELEAVRAALLQRAAMAANLTLDAASQAKALPALESFAAGLPGETFTPQAWHAPGEEEDEGFTLPAPVNYVGKGANLKSLGIKISGSASVITKTIGTTWLWDKVRVQGGAYGGMEYFEPATGVLNFLSYRDPNLLQTLDVYDQTANFLRELRLSDDELTKSIIGAIGDLDPHLLPDAKGYTSMVRHFTGYTEDMRQQYRDEVLSTTSKHFNEFADAVAAIADRGHVVVIGNHDTVTKANEERGGFLKVKKVL
ncbi:MAG: peptidase M16 [Anaerolineae bacterium]|nr:MAG: peptidase M16 [Anaerolineae bacterium]